MPRSNKYNKSYGLNSPLQDIFPEPVVAQRSPGTGDLGYRIGQVWVDQSSGQIYCLASVSSGSATWSILGPGASDVDTLTGDTGGTISPIGGNIDLLGGDLITVAGSAGTLTFNSTAGAYPITPYVVGPSGEAGYTTIQAAVDAANTAGGGLVFIQPGTYTENLTLYDGIALFGSSEQETFIDGTHTPPTSGTLNIFRLTLQDASAIFSSAAAGTTTIIVEDCTLAVTNGFSFDLLNWTGAIELFDIGPGGTNDGGVRNTGGATFAMFAAGLGNGTGQTMILSGPIFVLTSTFGCPIDFQTGADGSFNTTEFNGPLTFSNDSTISILGSTISSGASAAVTMSSSGACSLLNCGINSSNDPAIDGAGAGTLTVTGLDFVDNANFASTLTLAGGTTTSGTFETLDQSAGLSISGDDIDAIGSSANISITVSPKGTGDFVVDVGDIQDTAGDIIATRSAAGADVTVEATNSDNTSATSRAGFEAAVGGTSSGDPYVNFLISGGQAFTMGIDNSTTNDDFVISDSAALGTTNRVSIDGSTGVVTTVSGLTSTGTTTILDSVNANTSINTGTSTGTVSIGNSAAGAITIDTAAGISLDGATASNFTVTGAADLTVQSTAGSIVIDGGEAVADAVQITASDAAGGVTISAGTGNVNVSGNLVLSDVATQFQMNGGAATDFIGQATLAAGTATVANTNIDATDRIFLTRTDLNSSTALGELTVTAQTASTSFVITAIDPSDGTSTIAGDTSIVNYIIVRQN